jgi:hypothetical protein
MGRTNRAKDGKRAYSVRFVDQGKNICKPEAT